MIETDVETFINAIENFSMCIIETDQALRDNSIIDRLIDG